MHINNTYCQLMPVKDVVTKVINVLIVLVHNINKY